MISVSTYILRIHSWVTDRKSLSYLKQDLFSKLKWDALKLIFLKPNENEDVTSILETGLHWEMSTENQVHASAQYKHCYALTFGYSFWQVKFLKVFLKKKAGQLHRVLKYIQLVARIRLWWLLHLASCF